MLVVIFVCYVLSTIATRMELSKPCVNRNLVAPHAVPTTYGSLDGILYYFIPPIIGLGAV